MDCLLATPENRVVVYDNFTSGRLWHLESHLKNPCLTIVQNDIHEFEAVKEAMKGASVVIHLASNPDIAASMKNPDIDFKEVNRAHP